MLSAFFGILKTAALTVWNALSLAVKLLYKILKFLRIRILTLYVLVSAVLSAFLPVFGAGIVYFWVGFALCAALTAGSWIYAARRRLAARPRAEEPEEEAEKGEEQRAEQRAEPPAPAPAPPERYPKYFDVEGAPQYFFAEYTDRYELYMRDEGKAIYIRTDYKQ